MKGAVNYIVAIVLGVAVIALLGYWFFYAGGQGRQGTNEAECIAVKIRFCTFQTQENWDKIKTKCGKQFENDECYKFCSSIIPGWEPIQGTSFSGCSKPTTP
ncbi:MAG: hypothetical protein HYT70_00615 [Candidatus Aenigmarchaeota archaeon]|nr:hypothetical protein [Candidatus Aenigmarchaeota archaeon]